MAIRFGIWLDFRNPEPWHRDPARLYAETLELAAFAEQLGFDDIWTSEHHFVEDGYLSASLATCAAIAARTTRVRIGTNVLLLPLHDPIRVAEDAATVDLLSGGRLDLGVAVGYRTTEFHRFGVDPSTRGARMDEALEVLRACLSQPEVSYLGRFYTLDRVTTAPRPLQNPMPLLVGALSRRAASRAGRLGTGLLGPELLASTLDEERSARIAIDEFLGQQALVRPGTRADVALGPGFGFLSEDPDRDATWVVPHLAYRRRLYAAWFSEAGLGREATAQSAPDGEFRTRFPWILVSPADALARVRSILERYPEMTRLFFWAVPPGAPIHLAARSLELFAERVIRPLRDGGSVAT